MGQDCRQHAAEAIGTPNWPTISYLKCTSSGCYGYPKRVTSVLTIFKT